MKKFKFLNFANRWLFCALLFTAVMCNAAIAYDENRPVENMIAAHSIGADPGMVKDTVMTNGGGTFLKTDVVASITDDAYTLNGIIDAKKSAQVVNFNPPEKTMLCESCHVNKDGTPLQTFSSVETLSSGAPFFADMTTANRRIGINEIVFSSNRADGYVT